MHDAYNTCECMHTLRKNAYGLVHARLRNGAQPSLLWKLLRTYLESCASIVQAVVCRPLPPLLLSRLNPLPDVVRTRNPSKSTLAHDAVAAAVLHKYYSIIRVTVGLIQFVYGSHSHFATGVCVCCFVLLTQYWGIVTVPDLFLFRGPGEAESSPFTSNTLLVTSVPSSSSSNRPTTTTLTTRALYPGSSVVWAGPKFVRPHW